MPEPAARQVPDEGPAPRARRAAEDALDGLAEALADERFGPRQRPPEVAGHRLLGELGRGGMGVVYRALQPCPRREVALKLVRPSRVCPRAWRRLQREIELHGRLSHPGIVTVLQAGVEADGAPWLTMELVDGCCLSDHLREQRPDLAQRLELAAQVADAVAHAHDHGVLHGDLSPSNVLVDRQGRVRVIDFGLARALGPAEGLACTAEGSPELAGTLPFLAPEQVDPRRGPVDERTDIHALGALLYLLIWGRPPLALEALPRAAALALLASAEPRPPAGSRPPLGAALERVVATALRRDPARRFPSVRALARALAACPERRGEALPGALPTGSGRRARSPSRMRRPRRAGRSARASGADLPWRLAAILGVLLGLAGGGLLAVSRSGAADRELDFHARHGLGQVGGFERARHLAWMARHWAGQPDRQARCLLTMGQDLERLGEPGSARLLWSRGQALLADRDDLWSRALAASLTRGLERLGPAAPRATEPGRAAPRRPQRQARPLPAAAPGEQLAESSGGAGADGAGDPGPAGVGPGPGPGTVSGLGAGRPVAGSGAAQAPERPSASSWTTWQPPVSASPLTSRQGGWSTASPRSPQERRPRPWSPGPPRSTAPDDGLQLMRVLAASLLQQRAASGRGPGAEQLARQLWALNTGELAPQAVLVWSLTAGHGPLPPGGSLAWTGAWPAAGTGGWSQAVTGLPGAGPGWWPSQTGP